MGAWIRGELRLMETLAAAFLTDVETRFDAPEAFVAQLLAGITCWCRGDFTAARTHLERACEFRDPERNRELARHFDVAPGVGALTYLALTLWLLGETEQAARLFDEALALAKSCDDEKSLGYVVLHRSIVKGMQGEFAETGEQLARLLHRAQELRLPQYIVWAQGLHGWITWLAGDHAAGAAEMIEARAFRVQHGIIAFKPLYDAIHAPVLAMAGRMGDALALLDEGERTMERTGERWAESELHRQRGELLLRRAPLDAAAAKAAFCRALDVAKRQRAKTLELRAALPLARLLHADGHAAEARVVLVSVLEAFVDTPTLPDIAKARLLLAMLAKTALS